MALFKALPLDLTGVSETNLRLDERRTLSVARGRVIATDYGPFYADSLVVRTVPQGTVLQEGQDYDLLFDMKDATQQSGLRVVAIIYLHNTSIQGDISFDYQAVGGEFGSYEGAIQYAMEQLELDNRSISYNELLGVPETFPPSYHIHSMYETYGWEEVVQAAQEIRDAIEFGSEEKYDEVVTQIEGLQQAITNINASIGDIVNPVVYGKKTFTVLPNTYIVSVGTFFIPDNATGPCSYSLPPNPKDGDMIEWAASNTLFSTNPMTLLVSDKPIEGDEEGLVINQDRVCGRLIYRSALGQWQTYQVGLKGLAAE